jgi:hypothetical protein
MTSPNGRYVNTKRGITDMNERQITEADLKQLVLCKVWSNHLDRMNAAGIRGRIEPPPATHSMLSMVYDIARWMVIEHVRRHHTE